MNLKTGWGGIISRMAEWMNKLHYGDNLEVLREKIDDEVADLIYLDPPFNSQRTYNLLFKQVKGDPVPAQIMAFEDTWTWSPLMLEAFRDDPRNAPIFDLVESLYRLLGDSEMMAYVLMMGPRLLELHRKLKTTGSLYLHCDPVASHYLKILLDAIFGPANFRNEITWKRQTAHSDAKHKFADVADSILFYAKSSKARFQPVYVEHDPEYVKAFYKHDDGDGKGPYRTGDIASPNPRPNMMYEWKGFPWPAKGWRFEKATMERLDAEGRIVYPRKKDGSLDTSKRPQVKRYLSEMAGSIVTNVWNDISPIQGASKESRGYPTQKPLSLLERIIAASSKPGDVVLDPFCGCGTAVVAAQRMGRKWIGIDVTYVAISEIVFRLSTETEAKRDKDYMLVGTPKDEMSARKFFEETKKESHKPFEMWGVHLVEGEPREKKGGDKGIDGRIPFRSLDKTLHWGMIQVKGGSSGPGHVRDFARVIEREKALLGLFICFNRTKEMREEAEKMGYAKSLGGTRKIPRMQILTIKELLEEKKQFEIPQGYRIPRNQGVGKKSVSTQMAMPLDADDDLDEPGDPDED